VIKVNTNAKIKNNKRVFFCELLLSKTVIETRRTIDSRFHLSPIESNLEEMKNFITFENVGLEGLL
jgi:hypothetical protein